MLLQYTKITGIQIILIGYTILMLLFMMVTIIYQLRQETLQKLVVLTGQAYTLIQIILDLAQKLLVIHKLHLH